jgi:hypothetical protein
MEDIAEFLRRPDVLAVLEDWAEVCLNRVREDQQEFFPEPTQFLRDEGIRVPESVSLAAKHTTDGEKREQEWSDGDRAKSVPICEVIDGTQHCFYVRT